MTYVQCFVLCLREEGPQGSVSAPGARQAGTGHLFLTIPHPCLFLSPPHQTICPQEGKGDVATSDLVPFYWGPREGKGDVAIPPTRSLQGRFAVYLGDFLR